MENSSKALLIAGAILVTIVVISLGMKVFNSTSGLKDKVDSDSQNVSTSSFNSQFTTYFSNSTSGSQAKALVYKVMSNNSISDRKVLINFYSSTGAQILAHQKQTSGLQSIYDKISNSSKYKILATKGCGLYNKGYDNGYIACISIHTLP